MAEWYKLIEHESLQGPTAGVEMRSENSSKTGRKAWDERVTGCMFKVDQETRDEGGWQLGQVRGSGYWLLPQGFLSVSLVLPCHHGDNSGDAPRALPRFGPRGVAEGPGVGGDTVDVRFPGDDVVDLPAEDVADLHHIGRQEAGDDVEDHQTNNQAG